MTKTALKEFIRRSANHEIRMGSHGRWTVIPDSRGAMAIVTLDDSLPGKMEKHGAVRSEKDISAVAKKVVTDIADHNGSPVLGWMEIHKGGDSRVLLLARRESDTKVSDLDPAKWEIFRRADLVYTEGGTGRSSFSIPTASAAASSPSASTRTTASGKSSTTRLRPGGTDHGDAAHRYRRGGLAAAVRTNHRPRLVSGIRTLIRAIPAARGARGGASRFSEAVDDPIHLFLVLRHLDAVPQLPQELVPPLLQHLDAAVRSLRLHPEDLPTRQHADPIRPALPRFILQRHASQVFDTAAQPGLNIALKN